MELLGTQDLSYLNHLLEGCQIISPDFRYVFVNDAVTRQAGRTREELIGRRMADAFPGIDRTRMFSVLERCMVERTAAEFENEFTYPDGSTRWYSLRMEPVPDGLFILSIDISDRKLIEEELAHQLRRLEALRAVDLAIIGNAHGAPALQAVADRAVDTLQVDAAAVFLGGEPARTHAFAAGRGFRTRSIEHVRVRSGEGTAGRAVAERANQVVPETSPAEEPFDTGLLLSAEEFRSTVAAPLVARGGVVGVLQVYMRRAFTPTRSWLDFFDSLAGQAVIAIESARMFEELEHANSSLVFAYDTTIEGWSRALDLRDRETLGHTARVTELTLALCRLAGLPEEQLVHVRRGALLHDIGKMGIPDTILLKEGDLTSGEWAVMRQHPSFAFDMLYPIEYLRPALAIPYCHHERWDGSGYPRGLKAEQIPLAARIFAVADVWDALCSDRPYRKAWGEPAAVEYIRAGSGSHFDPAVVELFTGWLAQRRGPAHASGT